MEGGGVLDGGLVGVDPGTEREDSDSFDGARRRPNTPRLLSSMGWKSIRAKRLP